jgi:hypothetical protein
MMKRSQDIQKANTDAEYAICIGSFFCVAAAPADRNMLTAVSTVRLHGQPAPASHVRG